MKNSNQEVKISKTDKIKSMEHESNVTLISTTVAIVSFFVLFYAQSVASTNFELMQTFPFIVGIVYAISSVAVTVFAIITKKKWLWEYAVFGYVLAIGYYFMANPGISGLGLFFPQPENGIIVTPTSNFVAKVFSSSNIKYGLWTVNLVYCILTITIHSLKYNKIKKTKVIK